MKDSPAEETAYHTRIMKCTLEIEHSRAYWQHCEQTDGPVSVEHAFEKAIFGSRTYMRAAEKGQRKSCHVGIAILT